MINEDLKIDECVLGDKTHVLLPAIFVQDGRVQFRKEFIRNYPSFIHLLRISIPQITSSEEILCMLIFLGQSTEEISAILGICRKSVNQSRYRLRQKMDIPSSLTLEEFVHRLLPDS